MTAAVFMKLLHILMAFLMVTGVMGRDLTFLRARSAGTLDATLALLHLSEFFERRMVIPGAILVFFFGLATALLQRWPILGFLQGGSVNWVLVSLMLFLLVQLFLVPELARRSRQRKHALDVAITSGTLTPELRAALNDPTVARLRTIELALIGMIIVLMVLKPF